MRYPNEDDLKAFVEECEQELLKNKKNRSEIVYPDKALVNDSWDHEMKKDEGKIASLLKNAKGNANIYAIFTAPRGSNKFTPVYIGQRKKNKIDQRLRKHLIYKSKGTGSKLENVQNHVLDGGKVQVSWILVEPEPLRHYVEEELINKYELANGKGWNRHS